MPRNITVPRFPGQYPNPSYPFQTVTYPAPTPGTLLPRSHGSRFSLLENRILERAIPIRPNVAIHEPTLDILDIKYDVLPVLQQSGLYNLRLFEEKNVYPLSIEFLSSFRAEYDIQNDCLGWSYRLGSILFHQNKRDLCMLFGFLLEGAIPIYSDRERRRFYKKISGMDYFTPNCSPARIEDHAWRFIHLFISTNIFPRGNGDPVLTEQDLDLMIAIHKREKVDYFELITAEIERMANNSSYGQVLGAGVIASTLATHHGFSLDGIDGDRLVFDIPYLVQKAVLYPTSHEWIVIPESEEYALFAENDDMEEEEEEEDPEEDPNWEEEPAWEENAYIPAPPVIQENGYVYPPPEYHENGIMDVAEINLSYSDSDSS